MQPHGETAWQPQMNADKEECALRLISFYQCLSVFIRGSIDFSFLFGAWPEHSMTGSCGYFGNAESLAERSHR